MKHLGLVLVSLCGLGLLSAARAQTPSPVPVLSEPLPPLPVLHPLMDYPMRDTCICLAPDGMYYLTGTTGDPDWWAVTSDIRVWKSPDLKDWTPVVTKPRPRTTVWNLDREGT